MAKLYNFRLTLRRADFWRAESGIEMVTVPFGGNGDIYHDSLEQLTFAEAKGRLHKLSELEGRSHRAFLSMGSRSERKPRGMGNGYSINKKGAQA